MIQIKNRYTGEVILEVESLFDADLSGADLRAADLSNADLMRVNLTDSDLRGANLSNANLRYASLRFANLTDSDLSNADLGDDDLRAADLMRSNLRGVNLTDSDLRGAYFEGASNYYSFVAYDTSKRLVHCVKHNTTWMIQAGCFWGTLEELEKKVLHTHKSSVYLANIEILKTI